MTEVVSRQKSGKKPPKTPTKTQLLKKCDATFSKIIRSAGSCHACGGMADLQCAHGFSRRYRSVRWDTRNAFCLCRGHHFAYTVRPLEWDQYLRDAWGEPLYDELRHLALTGPNPDLAATFSRLRAELDEIERNAE